MTSGTGEHERGIPFRTATALVISAMVGTGVFTSLGFQVGGLPSPFVILAVWLVGGLLAFCGAVAYAELAAALPRSGGEYWFLSRVYHPALGFVSGWVSATVGFAAPIALAAAALAEYATNLVGGVSERGLAAGLVIGVTLVHSRSIRMSQWFQDGATAFKLALVVGFLVAGWAVARPEFEVTFVPEPEALPLLVSTPFFVSLFWVMYSFSGWNAATYVAGEVADPQRNVPRALLWGTALVTVLYMALNALFLWAAPMSELAGQVDVAAVAAKRLFGEQGGKWVAGLIAIGLVASVSAMTWAGPRVTRAMGRDLPGLRWLAVEPEDQVPRRALWLQLAIVLGLVATSTFETILYYIQFTLQLMTMLTVAGVIVLRLREPDLERPFRAWGYPVTPIVFVGASALMLAALVRERPIESGCGLATALAGLAVYGAAGGRMKRSEK